MSEDFEIELQYANPYAYNLINEGEIMTIQDISKERNQTKILVKEICPVCGELTEEIWNGKPATSGDGYVLNTKPDGSEDIEVISGCRH